ncbi:helix-turn-helix domain-containing protein [Dongia rigui]|uniref:Helix-turn-helix domain-containing protein n=1 Tax=Dongia rigui TaxID=940149 RepID=A0ABU5DWL1_9PROT|nr:helix-turn-helix domain-containing protein [Dongia rigui]MDY0871372.1 helix-turn-helix domain-containing protein [Dongia rigui]
MPLRHNGPPRSITFSTDDVPPPRRRAYWQASLAEVHLAMAIELSPERSFHAALEAHPLHDMMVIKASMTAHRARKLPSTALMGEEERCLLLINLDGYVELRQGQRAFSLSRHDIAMIDLQEPFDYHIPEQILVLALNLPRQSVAERLPQSADFAGIKLPASQPMQPITLSFFNNLFSTTGTAALHPPTSLRIAGHAVDLLGIALADVIDSRPNPSPYRANLLRRIKDFIEENLHEPLLRVETVAAKYRISTRYLAMLFRADGTTFSDFLRQRRLDRCRRQLEDRGAARRQIGEIALGAGFTSQAHFSRLFRATYQKTPRQYRSAFEGKPGPTRPTPAAPKPKAEMA